MRKVAIPNIKEGHRQSLNQPVTMQEVDWAITNLKLGKTPGLYGLTAEFYNVFRDPLAPYLKELFDYCIMASKIPDTWREARLMLIPKEGRDIADLSGFISSDRIAK